MPELPEVETLRRGLEKHFAGHLICSAQVLIPKMLKGDVTDPERFTAYLHSARIENISRRGKHLIFCLDNGYYLLLHLKMRGQLISVPSVEARGRYLAAVFTMDNDLDLRFHDIWTWGEMRLVSQEQLVQHPALKTMGKEPLTEEWTTQVFSESLLRSARTAVKAALLNQTTVAGVGNIYADESLFGAGILPGRAAASLSALEVEKLHGTVRSVLSEAIELGGSASDNYYDLDKRGGRYVPRVYDRAGQPCLQCEQTLIRTKISGRGTTYCAFCQR
jgi:formamidopyrimidine-DNA glycosylase